MKKIVLPLVGIALIATACDTSKSVSNNYYDDGIYHNPAKDERHYKPADTDVNNSSNSSFSLNDLEDNQETITTNPDANGEVGYYEPTGDEYYDPNASYSTGATGTTVVNNYYNSPSMVSPGWNMGVGWNSWGGWGMSIGYNWGYGGYYGGWYDPYWNYPWYSPYGCYGYYNPYWRWGYGGGYYGYNSYWAGYYDGYYHGSYGNDYYRGRNVVYVKNGANANRNNSYNNVIGRKSTPTQRSASTKSTGARSSQVASRNPNSASRDAVASTRFNDKNLSASRVASRNDNAVRTLPTTASRDGYRSTTSSYVQDRALTARSERAPVASENIRTQTSARTDYRSNTRVSTKEGYNRSNTTNTRSTTTTRPSSTNRSRSNDIYVPAEQRNKTYNQTPSNRSNGTYTPSNSRSQQTTPSRSNTPQNYSPSRNNNSYTPSRSNSSPSYSPSSSPSRSYTPSSSSPSRSSGGSRSSGASRSGGRR